MSTTASRPAARMRPRVPSRRLPLGIRRALTAHDVAIEILYCGVSLLWICTSAAMNGRRGNFNAVSSCGSPVTRLAGRVVEIAPAVTKFTKGILRRSGGNGRLQDDSARAAAYWMEQYCETGLHVDLQQLGQAPRRRHLWRLLRERGRRRGVVLEAVLPHPRSGGRRAAGVPITLLAACGTGSRAGKKADRWSRGLGHMGESSLGDGVYVVAFTTSPHKSEDARRLRRGRGRDLVRRGPDGEALPSFDFSSTRSRPSTTSTPSCRSSSWTVTPDDGGAPEKPLPVQVFNLLLARRQIAGSGIGGIAEDTGDARLLRARSITSPATWR